jgi:hypothetical protein
MRPLKSNLLFSNKLWRRWDKNWLKGKSNWRTPHPPLRAVRQRRPGRQPRARPPTSRHANAGDRNRRGRRAAGACPALAAADPWPSSTSSSAANSHARRLGRDPHDGPKPEYLSPMPRPLDGPLRHSAKSSARSATAPPSSAKIDDTVIDRRRLPATTTKTIAIDSVSSLRKNTARPSNPHRKR